MVTMVSAEKWRYITWRLMAAMLLALGAIAPMRHVSAKLNSPDLWLVGGDLPYPVKIPVEELQNPGTRRGEAFGFYRPSSADVLGLGYDIMTGADSESAFHHLQPDGMYETYYPQRSGRGGVVRYWRPLTVDYSSRTEDRQDRNWETATGGLYELIPRYIALTRSGLIGEQPTFTEAMAASVKLTTVRVTLNSSPTSGGTVLSVEDSRDLTHLLATLSSTRVTSQWIASTGPFYQLWVHFGDGDRLAGLQYLYAPPGAVGTTGMLSAQFGWEPDRISQRFVFNSTSELDGLVGRYGVPVISSNRDEFPRMFPASNPSLGSGGAADSVSVQRRTAAFGLAILGIICGLASVWTLYRHHKLT